MPETRRRSLDSGDEGSFYQAPLKGLSSALRRRVEVRARRANGVLEGEGMGGQRLELV